MARVNWDLVTALISLITMYCKMRKFSGDKFSPISPSKSFHSFNFHYSIGVLFYIIIKVTFLEAFHFHWFASSVEIVKSNCR